VRLQLAVASQPVWVIYIAGLGKPFRLGAPCSGEWLSGNSRPRRSRICEPWRCFAIREANVPTWGIHLARLGKPTPLSPTIFMELKPQQTGTRLLIGYGEVATTSGSTNFLPGRLISRTPPFEGGHVGANPAPAANSFSLGGEIASRLAYTQKSEGQNLPERPFCR
jgi:hypothetical protein